MIHPSRTRRECDEGRGGEEAGVVHDKWSSINIDKIVTIIFFNG